jgi:PKD repeat protein
MCKYRKFILIAALLIRFCGIAQDLSLVLPKNGQYFSTGSVDFEWNNYGSVVCQVEISTMSDFSEIELTSPLFLGDTWNTSSLTMGQKYWRVRFQNSTSWNFSPVGSFKIFAPDQLTTLSLHLTPEAGVTLDADNKISDLLDQSSNAFTLSQSNNVKRPTIETNVLNGHDAFKFSGGQCLIGGDILDLMSSSRTMFVVGKTSLADGAFFAKSKAGAAPNRYAMLKEVNKYLFLMFDNQSVGSPLNSLPGYNGFGLFQATVDRPGANFSFEVNNTLVGTSAFTTTGPINSTFRFIFGAYNNSGDNGEVLYFNGNINEVVFIESADATQKNDIRSYLRYKYAPPLNLGKDSTILTDFCPINLSIASNFSDILWSTGETSATISIKQPGLYWVEGKDIFGFVSRDTIQINYPEILDPSTNFICDGQSTIWDVGLGSSYSYLWSTGVVSESLSISAPGTYSVTVTDGLGCTRTSDPITFSVDYYENTAYLGADTSLCTGNPLSLQIGASETVSYAWQGGAPSTQATYPVGPTGNYWLQSTNINGCVARDTIFITNVGTAPIANFLVQDHCLNGVAPIEDQSMGVGTDVVADWTWDMGNGVVINRQNPEHTYPAPGVYPVELYVQASSGCGSYAYDTIEVFTNPSASFTFTGHCQKQEIQFFDASSAGGSSISAYNWNFGIPSTGAYNFSTIPIPNRIFDQVGSYNVKLLVSDNNGCEDSIVKIVKIDPSPVTNFVFESTCQGTPIQFLSTSNTQPGSIYAWDFGNNTSSILINPKYTYSDHGFKKVSLTVTNTFDCSSTAVKDVEVYANPVISMLVGSACKDSYVSLENTSEVSLGAIDSTLWVINQTDTLYGKENAWFVNALGQQQVQLYTWSTKGCRSQKNQFFEVNEQFNASFSTGTGIVAVGQPFVFQNTSNAGSIALWTFGDGAFSTKFSPEHTYDANWQDSTLEVMLVALNTAGCSDTSVKKILVRRAMIDMEVSQLFLQKDGLWYKIGVKLKNSGTVDLVSADFIVETNKGLLFNELWDGILKPMEDSIYVFNAMPTSIFNNQDAVESYICLGGLAYDLYQNRETYLENNNVCSNIEGEEIVILPVFPNPVAQDFNVRIFLSNTAEVYLTLDDDKGRTIRRFENGQTLSPGYYDYPVNVAQIANGIYYIHLRSARQTKSLKVSVIK